MTLLEAREKRAKLVADARKVVELADAEKRSMNAEDQAKFDVMMKDAAEMKGDIERREKLETEEAVLNTSTGRRSAATPPGTQAGDTADKPRVIEFRDRKITVQPGTPEYRRSSDDYNTAFRNYIVGKETRTAASFANDVTADGGYLHTPIQFNAMLLKFLDNLVWVRQRAKVLPVTTSDTLGTPTLATDMASTSWSTEVAAQSADAAAQFGRRDLKPNLLAKLVVVSQKLLATAAISPEEIVADRLAYSLAIAEENAYLTGTGSAQPLGVYTASASGVPTSQDVVCASSTAIAADDLIGCKYGLRAQYRARARWNFSRTAVQNISKLKDSQNRYLWQVGISPGQPDTLLGLEIDETEYAPATFTTGLYVGGLFNWDFYWIADLVTGFEMQRLNELYAATSQVGFIGRKYADGAPVVPAAFSRLKLA